MTEKLYDKNSFLREFTAAVTDSGETARGYFTVLDKTAFFPEGGGQASDIGYINGVRVYDVQIKDGIIYHYTEKPFSKGQEIEGVIDFDRRFDFMQQHSAEHIVSGIAHTLYGCENVGFHLGSDIVTLDFDKYLSDEQLLKLEQIANEKVYENVKFNCYYPTESELMGLNYRSKKELEGAIRIVEIENTDICACCAPHVKNAGQIGVIKLLDTEKLRGGIRIELKAGNRALTDYNQRYKSVRKISSLLCAQQTDAAEAVERLLESDSGLKQKISDLKRKLITEKVNGFNPHSNTAAEFLDDSEIKDLQLYADALYKKAGGVRAVLSGCDGGFYFAICGDETALSELFKRFKEAFNVKGGGRGNMVQGTVFAKESDIKSFFL